MRGNFSEFVSKETLIQFKWDTSNIKGAMSEIISIFKKQQNYISELNEKVKLCANNEEFYELKDNFNKLKEEIDLYKKENNDTIDNINENIKNSIQELRDWTDTSNAAVLVDVRREIASSRDDERRMFFSSDDNSGKESTANFSTDDKIRYLKDEILSMQTDMRKLASNSFVKNEIHNIQKKLNEVDDNSFSIKHILERLHDLDGKVNVEPPKRTIEKPVIEEEEDKPKRRPSYAEPVKRAKSEETEYFTQDNDSQNTNEVPSGLQFNEEEAEPKKSTPKRKVIRKVRKTSMVQTTPRDSPKSPKSPRSPRSSKSPSVPEINLSLTHNIAIYDTNFTKKKELKLIQPIETPSEKKIKAVELDILNSEDIHNTERSIRTINENIVKLKYTSDHLTDLTNQLVEKQNDMVRLVNSKNQQFSQDIEKLQEVTSPRVQDQKFQRVIDKIETLHSDFYKFKVETQGKENIKSAMMSAFESIPLETNKKKSVSSTPSPPSPPLVTKEIPHTIPVLPQSTPKTPSISQFMANIKLKDSAKSSGRDSDESDLTSSRNFDLPPGDQIPQGKIEKSIKIVKSNDKQQKQLLELANKLDNVQNATISMDEIQEKVDLAIKRTLKGFLERIRGEVQKDIQEGLKSVNQVKSLIETKIDREFVDRMFNKFRVLILELKEKVDNTDIDNYSWVTRTELEEVLARFAQSLSDVKDTSATQSKYRCLLCGTPRTHMAGMMTTPVDDEVIIDYNTKPASRPRTASIVKQKIRESKEYPNTTRKGPPRDVVSLIMGS